jgi:hypothetical protein
MDRELPTASMDAAPTVAQAQKFVDEARADLERLRIRMKEAQAEVRLARTHLDRARATLAEVKTKEGPL